MFKQTYFRKAVHCCAVFLFPLSSISQGYQGIDVRMYNLDMSVTDSSNVIRVKEDIYFFRTVSTAAIAFDLVGPRVGDGKELMKGMTVSSCKLQGEAVPFIQDQDKVFLKLPETSLTLYNDKMELHLELSFSGIPANGLIIGNNMYTDRTFFADNWPNRAHHWFACNDHVSDKAEFNVTVHAPEKYEVVANGVLVREAIEKGGTKVHQYESNIPLPVKVMVVGIADLVIQNFTEVNGIQVSGAVYPQNQTKALYDLKLSPDILKFYCDLFGKYPFEKMKQVSPVWRNITDMENFRAEDFKEHMTKFILATYPDADPELMLKRIKSGVANQLIKSREESILEMEDSPSISGEDVHKMSVDQFLKFVEDRAKRAAEKMKSKIIKLYSKEGSKR
jgi:hypothetical protein